MLRQADQLVANDVVREAELALELVEGAATGEALDHEVVAGFLLVDRVREGALSPPIGLAVNRPTGLGDFVGDELRPGLGLCIFDVAVDDDHQLVRLSLIHI